jgi:two-component system KDP operon response regulator KdpE
MKDNNQLVLIVDDEPKLVRLVKEVLSATGFDVLAVSEGKNAIDTIALENPNLVLLDIVLADEVDGYEVTERVREFSNVPIIMLTAKTRESDLLRGFDVGVDDYIMKPFSAKELLARVRAVLMRTQVKTGDSFSNEIICGPLYIDLARRRVMVNEKVVHLTRTEYNLLYELAIHLNKVVLHTELLSSVWGPEYRDDLEYLRAYICYLRRKIEPDPEKPIFLLTSPGVGYMLECPDNR